MKLTGLLSLFALFLFAGCGGTNSNVEVGNKTTIEVDEVFDAGEVLKGEKIKAVFLMKNTGEYPLTVSDIKGSCTCTVVKKPNAPILPGESFEIKAEVNTEKTGAGAIVKGIDIVANTNPSITRIKVQATVLQNK